jgi:hypothetical protein
MQRQAMPYLAKSWVCLLVKRVFLLQKARKLGKFFSNELGRTFSLSFSPSRGKKYSFEANMPSFPPIPSFMPFGMENHNNHK